TASNRNNTAFLLVDPQYVGVNYRVIPLVYTGIDDYSVIGAIEFAPPFVTSWLTVRVGSPNRYGHLVARSPKHNDAIPCCSSREPRLSHVQLPGAHLDILSKKRHSPKKAKHQSQYDRCCFHLASYCGTDRVVQNWRFELRGPSVRV